MDVIGIDCYLLISTRLPPSGRALTGVLGRAGFTFVESDLRHESISPHLDDVDVLVNLAAMPGLTSSWIDFKTYVDCNTTLTQRLLSDLRLHPEVHFVQASTSSVYGAVAEGDEDGSLLPGLAVRRHQTGRRAVGLGVPRQLRPSRHDAALLLGLWA